MVVEMAKIYFFVLSDFDVFIMPTCLGTKAVKVIIFRRKHDNFFMFRSKHSLRVHLEPPQGGSNEYLQNMFKNKIGK